MARSFLTLVSKHFPAASKLHKIFNKNSVKVSYNCLPNVAAIIRGHNTLLSPQQEDLPCNCRAKPDCPMRGKCQTQQLVYKAEVKSSNVNPARVYFGATEPTLRTRYGNHKYTFNHEQRRKSTELSKYVWQLKERQEDYSIQWSISERARAYSSISKRCQLCLSEKFRIITAGRGTCLNRRSELISKCRHTNKFSLANYTGSHTHTHTHTHKHTHTHIYTHTHTHKHTPTHTPCTMYHVYARRKRSTQICKCTGCAPTDFLL